MSNLKSSSRLNGTGRRKNDRLKYLDLYLDAGMRVVGLDGKKPAESNWPKVPIRSRDEIPIRRWNRRKFNFGWILTSPRLDSTLRGYHR